MAGNINGMGSKVQGAIDQGLQNGTINQDQAKQLNDDLGGLQQALVDTLSRGDHPAAAEAAEQHG